MHFEANRKAILALTLASIIWGATPAVMKVTLASVPPFSLALIRFGTASIFLLPFVFTKLRVLRRDILLVLLAGLFGVGIHIPLFFLGLKLTTALNAGIFVASIPIFTLLFAHVILRERTTKNLIAGALLGSLGIGVIIGQGALNVGVTLSPIGDALLLFSTLSFVFFEIVSKKLFKTYKPLIVTFYSFMIGAAVFAPFAYAEFQNNPAWFTNLPKQAVFGMFYGIFFSSFAAYSLWQWGLSKLDASRVGFFLYLDPIVATVVAVLLLSEKITVPFVIGALLIFFGLFLAERKLPHYHHLRKLR